MAFGLREAARLPEAIIAKSQGSEPSLDFSHIVALQFFLDHPTAPLRLVFDHIRLLHTELQPLLYSSIADEFGQFTKETWPGKITSEAALVAEAKKEEKSVRRMSKAKPDAYGGLEGTTKLATGFFRTLREGAGPWWLVTPTGHLFFSFGVDTIEIKGQGTYVEGREWMFTDLPAGNGSLSAFYGVGDNRGNAPGQMVRGFDHGRYFNFYAANLQRKYGRDFGSVWQRRVLDRMRAWGFNTIGNWSDEALTRAGDSRGERMPYVCSPWYGGTFSRVGTPQDWWGPLVDPFDPRFGECVEASLQSSLRAHRDDPYLLGYFVDNELSWAGGRNPKDDRGHYSLLYGVLQQQAQSPAKQAWVKILRDRYGSIDALNQSWSSAISSWDDFLAHPYSAPDTLTAGMRADFSGFLKRYAAEYFRIIAEVIHRHDPHHLYLGCRFASFAVEEVEACAEYCDVVSFNIYAPVVDPSEWAFLDHIDKPALVGEFHFGATDRGTFGAGIIPVADQKARAAGYQDYLRSVLTNPHFVGAHWFQYTDEPLTGRLYDGENYTIGLVSMTDTPYPELTTSATAVHREAYKLRLLKASGKH